MRHVVVKRRNRSGGWTFKCQCGFEAHMTEDGNYWVTEWGDELAQEEHQLTMYTGELPLVEKPERKRLFGFL